MVLGNREQGETRQQILVLLRHRHQMTAAELSDELGIGAVGVRQHLALLERDGLVASVGVRRGVGRPSHLYALTETANALFPRNYDRLVLDVLDFVKSKWGAEALDELFARRRHQLAERYGPRLAGKDRPEQVAALAQILSEQGYMCECQQLPDGSFVLIEHNCPIDCAARDYPQACSNEIQLYQDILGVPIVREETLSEGGTCCRYRINSA